MAYLKQRHKLEKLIEYFITKYKGLSRTHLMKLTYLFDRIYYIKKGVTYTRLNWIFHCYGPYSQKFVNIYKNMKQEGKINEIFESGRFHIFSNTQSVNDINFEKIAAEVVGELDEKISKFNLLSSIDNIKQYIYNLPEMKKYKFKKEIDFKILKED